MQAQEVVDAIIAPELLNVSNYKDKGYGRAPINIALVKYWGKRNALLNLPDTDSLSVSLPLYAETELIPDGGNSLYVNNVLILPDSDFYRRICNYLHLFNIDMQKFCVRTISEVPISAGLASSAAGGAALVKSILDYYNLDLPIYKQSILARLMSGSAARSVLDGFVYWQKGILEDGMDSYAEAFDVSWKDLCVGININNTSAKSISSRTAMSHVHTSRIHRYWFDKVELDIQDIKQAIQLQDIKLFGDIIESSSSFMHNMMHTSTPVIHYDTQDTIMTKKLVYKLRAEGSDVYFTQDAGSNLKLFFLAKDADLILSVVSGLHIMNLF